MISKGRRRPGKLPHCLSGCSCVFNDKLDTSLINASPTACSKKMLHRIEELVGGFNPFEKYESKWESSPSRGEHKTYLKPSPREWVGCMNAQPSTKLSTLNATTPTPRIQRCALWDVRGRQVGSGTTRMALFFYHCSIGRTYKPLIFQ